MTRMDQHTSGWNYVTAAYTLYHVGSNIAPASDRLPAHPQIAHSLFANLLMHIAQRGQELTEKH